MNRSDTAFNACGYTLRKTDLSMAEALNDPLIRTLMDADGVDPETVANAWVEIAEARAAYLEP